jgi:oligosaccharide repeat unit polymerase
MTDSWTLAYALSLLGTALFVISYYRNCYKIGYRIDLWHAHLFLSCVFPYLLMLPFARSELNALIVGKDIYGIQEVLPHVFLLVTAGYFSMLAGGASWKLHLGAGLRRTTKAFFEKGPRCSVMLMSSRSLLLFLSALCLTAQISLVVFYFASSGFGFNLRAYTFENPSIRPVSQIIALCSVIVISHNLARYLDTKERSLLFSTLLLTSGLLFFGQRGNLIFSYMNVAVCYVVCRRNSIGMFRILAWTIGTVALIFYLGSIREGIYSPTEFLASLALLAFYGNNFCDLRDFAWIYSHWDHQLWLGKTYLAGLATFLPRGISDFRSIWSFGIATDWTVGLDTELHPGLKPGEFGEAFFNFGLAGVIIGGFLIGILVRQADLMMKQSLGTSKPSFIRAFASTVLASFAACINTSLGIPALYALGGMYVIGWLWLRTEELLFLETSTLSKLPEGSSLHKA